MSTNIVLLENTILPSLPEDITHMLQDIRSLSPELDRANRNFLKPQSQFMDNMFTISNLTPIRNLRQILAEMENTNMALGDTYYKIEGLKIKIKKIERKMEQENDDLELAALKNKKERIEHGIAVSMKYVEGSIRKLKNYANQYRAIMESCGIESFDELDFEEEEEKYHICKAFQQALSAARFNGGRIDEGNHIYFEQIGINGTVAQAELRRYLIMEEYMLSPVDENGNPKPVDEPTHQMQRDWILSMADKFKGCSKSYAQWKGINSIISEDALIKNQ